MDVKIETSRWDTSEFLECREDIDLYLSVAFETGDPTQIAKALDNASKALIRLDGTNAATINTTQSLVRFVENGFPSLQELTAIIDNLGYRLSVVPKSRVNHLPAN